ncbi:MAG: division/cell wall cluster transcriptional repressor MraZ [Desulfobacterales bacterium]|nr:division/cell wall cluster transcriptional repressor MraZ [Desulfobacterales bacterium]
MFRGSSFHNLDPKGRLIIPTRFRDMLNQSNVNGLMVSKMDGALFCYTFEQWHKIEERIMNMAATSDNMRRFRRIFLGGAFECLLDKQGRILIPPTLRQYSALNKEIVLVGVLDHFEIWSRESWIEEDGRLQNDLKDENIRNEIAALGL